jgi:glycosyltransferase involved in cell wall biosynthesis
MISLFKPLKLIIDANEANTKNRVGINVYAYKILNEIEKFTRNPRKAIKITILLSQKPVDDLPKSRLGWKYKVIKPKAFWTKLACPLWLIKNQHKYNVYFTFSHYLPKFLRIPSISSIMDLSYLIYPTYFKLTDYCKLKYWTKQSLKSVKKILTISNFTKNEIQKYYIFDEKNIFIGYPGNSEETVSFNKNEEREFLNKWNLNKPFFLFLGTIQPRKNLVNLIKAFAILKSKYRFQGKLVLAGKVGWKAEKILSEIQNSENQDDIILTNFISEKEKQILFKNTIANINIGFYEGFGIPTLEALQAKCMTLVTKDSALEEVTGKLGFKVDPNKIIEIAQNLDHLSQLTKNEKDKICRKTKKQISKFSWKRTSEKILKEIRALYYEESKSK